MATINQLTEIDTASAGLQFPVYSSDAGDSRKVTLTTIKDWLQANFDDVEADSLVATNYVKTTGVTVANLFSASTAGVGARSFVTDANATTFNSVVAGGGSNKVPVFSDGTNWRIG